LLHAINITLLLLTPQLSKYAITAAHEVSATREPISITEKRQQLTSRLSNRLREMRVSI